LAFGGQGGEDPLGTLHEDVSGFRVDGGAGSGITLVNRVTEEIVVEMLPKLLAGVGVKAGDSFLEVWAIAQITHDIDLSIGNDGGRLAGEVGFPEGILEREARGEIFFQGQTGLLWAAPTEPAADSGGRAGDERMGGEEQSGADNSKGSFHGMTRIEA